jgi:hypothetical protein
MARPAGLSFTAHRRQSDHRVAVAEEGDLELMVDIEGTRDSRVRASAAPVARA